MYLMSSTNSFAIWDPASGKWGLHRHRGTFVQFCSVLTVSAKIIWLKTFHLLNCFPKIFCTVSLQIIFLSFQLNLHVLSRLGFCMQQKRSHSKGHALLWVSHCSFPMGICLGQYFRSALCNLVTTNVCPAGAAKSILMMWGLRAAGDWHPSGKHIQSRPLLLVWNYWQSMNMMNDQFHMHSGNAWALQEYCERKVRYPYQSQCWSSPYTWSRHAGAGS